MIDSIYGVVRPRGLVSETLYSEASASDTMSPKAKELAKIRARAGQRPEEDPGPSPYMSVVEHGAPRASAAASPSKSRTLFNAVRSRLGMTDTATPNEVVAELDTKLAAASGRRQQKSAEDNAFDRVFGRSATAATLIPAPIAVTDDEAFKRVVGR